MWLWNVETSEQPGQPLQGHDSPVISVAWPPDGDLLATGGSDDTVRL